jgi:hypothetical protein
LARLQIRWEQASTIAPRAAATGDAEAKQGDGALVAERPMLIYVTTDDVTDNDVRKLEDICFKDERVGIGAKFFRCVKVSAADASEDRLLKEHGKDAPRLLFVKRDYEVVSVLEGRELSASKINKSMEKLCREEYTNSYSSMQSKYAKLLNELDRLDDVRAKLAADQERYGSDPAKYRSKLKKLEKSKADFAKDMEDWNKAEAAILELKLKEARRATT